MLTEWGAALDPENVLTEYPRPQMVRDSYLCLNGLWYYAITKSADFPTASDGQIVVPFSPECELSGVRRTLKADEYLWYTRAFELPEGFRRSRVLLHFGAVDQTATVYLNGAELYTHTGGYTPFTVDITPVLAEGKNALMVRVRDMTDASPLARGKQRTKRGGIWYTPQSGIWQTVWLESVPENYIRDLRIRPRFDERSLELTVFAGKGSDCRLELLGVEYEFPANQPTDFPVPDCEDWTPEDPRLYPFTVSVGEDSVKCYFAMRKVSVGKNAKGAPCLMLNNEPYYMNGLLDQGYWPDGLYTAPSDEALIFDIQTAKDMGFNTLRKHMKTEPLRWYYHCDRLGLLVWQDMPSGGGSYRPLVISAPLLTGRSLDDSEPRNLRRFARADAGGRTQFVSELREMVETLVNCPCVVLWTPFNEGWGQFDSNGVCEELRKMDRDRLIDHASGWHDQGLGDIKSLHVYFKKYKLSPDKLGRPVALTEFGGYGNRVEGHAFGPAYMGYKKCESPFEFEEALRALYEKQIAPAREAGLAAAIYTQLSDVEDELNGLLTYDRKIKKLAPATVKRIVE